MAKQLGRGKRGIEEKKTQNAMVDVTTPLGEDVESCKERVASGMKCYCLEHCACRECEGCLIYGITPHACNLACKTCSNHKPCKHCK